MEICVLLYDGHVAVKHLGYLHYHAYQEKFKTKDTINFRQFGNAILFCIPLVCFTYVMVYGKLLGNDLTTLPSVSLRLFAILSAASFVCRIYRQSPYYLLDVLKLRTIRDECIALFLLMFLNSSAMFVNVFAE